MGLKLALRSTNFTLLVSLQPNRTYYLDDPEGYAIHWSEAIENMRKLAYGDPSSTSAVSCSSGSSNSLAVISNSSAASSSNSPTVKRSSPVNAPQASTASDNRTLGSTRTGTSPSKKTASK